MGDSSGSIATAAELKQMRQLVAESRLAAKRNRDLLDTERKARMAAEKRLADVTRTMQDHVTRQSEQEVDIAADVRAVIDGHAGGSSSSNYKPNTDPNIPLNKRLVDARDLADLEAQAAELRQLKLAHRKRDIVQRVQSAAKRSSNSQLHDRTTEQALSLDELRAALSDAQYSNYLLRRENDGMRRNHEDMEIREERHSGLLVRVLQARFAASRLARAYAVLLKVLAVKLFVVERRTVKQLKALYATVADVNVHFREESNSADGEIRYGTSIPIPPVKHIVDGTGGSRWIGDGEYTERHTRRESAKQVSSLFDALSDQDAQILAYSGSSPRSARRRKFHRSATALFDGEALEAYLATFEENERSEEDQSQAILRKRVEVERVRKSKKVSTRDVMNLVDAEVAEMQTFSNIASQRLIHWHEVARAEQQGTIRLTAELVDMRGKMASLKKELASRDAALKSALKKTKAFEHQCALLKQEVMALKKDNVRLSKVKFIREADSARRLAERVRELDGQRRQLETNCNILARQRQRLAEEDLRVERERALTSLSIAPRSDPKKDWTFSPNIASPQHVYRSSPIKDFVRSKTPFNGRGTIPSPLWRTVGPKCSSQRRPMTTPVGKLRGRRQQTGKDFNTIFPTALDDDYSDDTFGDPDAVVLSVKSDSKNRPRIVDDSGGESKGLAVLGDVEDITGGTTDTSRGCEDPAAGDCREDVGRQVKQKNPIITNRKYSGRKASTSRRATHTRVVGDSARGSRSARMPRRATGRTDPTPSPGRLKPVKLRHKTPMAAFALSF